MVFRIVTDSSGRPERISDADRLLDFEFLGKVGMGSLYNFRLHRRSIDIGVRAPAPRTEFDAHGEHLVWRAIEVGQEIIRFNGPNVPAVDFQREADRQLATDEAIEALLVFGLYFDGEKFPPGYCVVRHAHRTFRLTDFGYAPSP